ncbi:MAG: GYF domain-containing protein [Synergistaceae bacterium]|jgi:hypothetical protein|nr:GYF domain-containing protein [Synergistaceae bacterium]
MNSWHCYINGQAYGPYPENLLRELINRGQLTTDTYVYNDSPKDAPMGWQRAGDTEIVTLLLNNPQGIKLFPPIQNKGITRVSQEMPKENVENHRHLLSNDGETQIFSSNYACEPGTRQFKESVVTGYAGYLWYYSKDGNIEEPVPADEIINLIKKKIITAGTLIYSDTFNDIGWAKASETEFADVFNYVPVPSPTKESTNYDSRTHIGKICPYCKAKIAASEDLKVCPICNMPHHQNCWDENKGCTTFGCSCRHHEEQRTNLSPDVSPSVAAAINLANASVVKKNKDRTVGYIAAAVVVFALVVLVGGFTSKRVIEAKKLYLSSVNLFKSRVLAAGSNLEDIADTIQRYWRENIYENRHGNDINAAIRYAQIDKMSEISNARAQKDDIDDLYKSVRNLPDDLRNDDDLRDIRDASRNLYNSYTDFYSLAISPTGNYASYSANNNRKTDDFLSNYRALSSLLD